MSLREETQAVDRPEPPTVGLDLDKTLYLLQSDRRRFALRHLALSGELTLDELSNRRAIAENGEDHTRQERKRVYVSYYQNHLAELAGVDAIEYNEASGVIVETAITAELVDLLGLLEFHCTEVVADE